MRFPKRPEYADRGPVQLAWLSWRRWLTRCFDGVRPLVARFPALRRQLTADAAHSWVEHAWVVALGVVCLLLGAVLPIFIAGSGSARSVAVVVAVEGLVWAGVRWLLMRLVGRGPADRGRALLGAWGLGLIPFALGLSPLLRLAAWTASAGLTWFGLVSADDQGRDATRTVGIAWAAQAAVVAVSWIARAGFVALLAWQGR